MKDLIKLTSALFLFALLISSCDKNSGLSESSTQSIQLDETYDEVQNGVWLLMNYDAASDSFVGTVENTEQKAMENINLKVELSDEQMVSLGRPFDLEAGEMKAFRIPANSEVFKKWTPVVEH